MPAHSNPVDLKLGQYTKLPPRMTFAAQMAGSIVGSIFNYTMMNTIVTNNREVLQDPVGTRVVRSLQPFTPPPR